MFIAKQRGIVCTVGNTRDEVELVMQQAFARGYTIEETDIEYVDYNGVYIVAEKQAELREKQFKAEFFQTSLGWIRRKVNMKDGSIKDFLADLLLPIKAGLELGQKVEIITYKTPDFTLDYNEEYIISLQERKEATAGFIQECLMQTVADFGG